MNDRVQTQARAGRQSMFDSPPQLFIVLATRISGFFHPVLCLFVAALLEVQSASSSQNPVLLSDPEPVKFMNFSRGQNLSFSSLSLHPSSEETDFLEPFPQDIRGRTQLPLKHFYHKVPLTAQLPMIHDSLMLSKWKKARERQVLDCHLNSLCPI